MNPAFSKLHAYPFEKLAALKAGLQPPADKAHIAMSLGEPKHLSPGFIAETIIEHLHGLSNYPVTRGSLAQREAMAQWLTHRFGLKPGSIDPERNVMPLNGSREGLFAFAQAVIDPEFNPLVLMPNPFYQVYEGAALLAGAEPWYMNTTPETGLLPDLEAVPAEVWRRCQLLYLCTPGNPTGAVMDQASLQKAIELADHYDFIVASDECYSEIYFDEGQPPPGLLQAAHAMGRDDYRRCIVFNSLSKRSNVPGLRSGLVAGDAELLDQFWLYRTYHGCAMPPPTQAASARAWGDEAHVRENRRLYREKFDAVLDVLGPVLKVQRPQAGFYLWPETPIDDNEFAAQLFAAQNVTVLPGSFLSRDAHGTNPGKRRVRMALVAPFEECVEAAQRIREFVSSI